MLSDDDEFCHTGATRGPQVSRLEDTDRSLHAGHDAPRHPLRDWQRHTLRLQTVSVAVMVVVVVVFVVIMTVVGVIVVTDVVVAAVMFPDLVVVVIIVVVVVGVLPESPSWYWLMSSLGFFWSSLSGSCWVRAGISRRLRDQRVYRQS